MLLYTLLLYKGKENTKQLACKVVLQFLYCDTQTLRMRERERRNKSIYKDVKKKGKYALIRATHTEGR